MTVAALADRLDRIVLYQAYPQSFADADGDGIGDLDGVVARLDYLAWLGVDAVWLTPVFVSPFRDAGYDVADFDRVAARYGGDPAMDRLIAEADRRGIGIVLDLVAGHTSDEHEWFVDALALGPHGDPDGDRYVFSPTGADGFAPVPRGDRGFYKPNFFEFQPALNFGYARPHPDEPWRQGVDAMGPRRNRDALVDIMRRWYDRGIAGFRVDMAASLVKDDPGHRETAKLWHEVHRRLDRTHPGRILISEWGDPARAVPAGFDVDFFLQFGGESDGLPLKSLFENGSGTVHEAWPRRDAWADAAGNGDAADFVAAWTEARDAIAAAGSRGVVGLPTANHDFTRLVSGTRDAQQARAALLLVLTWAAMPSLYYGDEIGMRYLPGVGPLEGSALGPTYERAGSRTPLAWGTREVFGQRAHDARYLPADDAPDAPTVADQLADPASLLRFVRDAVALRRSDPRLGARASVEVESTGYPFVYRRGGTLLVALNPAGRSCEVDLGSGGIPVVATGARVVGERLLLDAFGAAVVDLAPRAATASVAG